jgi:spectinomycin phosphotransferase
MLEKPDIQDERIAACLHDEYGLLVAQVAFLPLGVDRNSAVYRVVAGDGKPYFVKLRRGIFDEIAVTLPKFLNDQGIIQVIAPLSTKAGQLWASLDTFKAFLYPFIEDCATPSSAIRSYPTGDVFSTVARNRKNVPGEYW